MLKGDLAENCYTMIDHQTDFRVVAGMFLIRYVFMFIISVGIGLLLGYYDLELSLIDFTVMVAGLTLLLHLDQIVSFFVLYFSRNMDLVGKFLRKQKHPYYRALLDITKGNYAEASKKVERLKNWGRQQQMRAILKAALYLENNHLSEAKRETELIKSPEVRAYNYALIALKENEWESFAQLKSKLKNKALQYILEAEEAYKKGNLEKAELFGNQAIEAARGLQRYLLVASLERQETNADRDSYF